MTDTARGDGPEHFRAGETRPRKPSRRKHPQPAGRLVRWAGGASERPGALRRLVYTEDTVVVALLDSIGAYIYEAFPLPAGSNIGDSRMRRGPKLLAAAAEMRSLAEFLRSTQRSAEAEGAAPHLAATAAEGVQELERLAAELESGVAEAYSGSTAGDPAGERES